MQSRIIEILNQANQRFYAACGESFSASRQRPWEGWAQILDILKAEAELKARQGAAAFRILDIGCGNMRFEEYAMPQIERPPLSFDCIDTGDEMVKTLPECAYHHCDVVAAIQNRAKLIEPKDGLYDAVVSFGFMHHVPGFETRKRLLNESVSLAQEGGIIALSFWQFLENERLAAKAETITLKALNALCIRADQLEDGDRFLGWADTEDNYRYCHSFSEKEIGELLDSASDRAETITCYDSDTCNRYVILRRI